MSTRALKEEIVKVLEKHKVADSNAYVNPHFLDPLVNLLEDDDFEVPYDVWKWASDMWGH